MPIASQGDKVTIDAAKVGLLDRAGDHIRIESAQNAALLLLCGEPIDEPIVGSSPFVRSNAEEIRQTIADYQSGKVGHMP